MPLIRSIKIKVLLPILFAILVAISFAQGFTALKALSDLKAEADVVGRERVPRTALINTMVDTINETRRGYADYLLAVTPDQQREADTVISERLARRASWL